MTTYQELIADHIAGKRMPCRFTDLIIWKIRKHMSKPVPIWIAFILFFFWIVAVARLCVMVGGLR